MPLTINPSPAKLLSAQELAAWRAVPAAVVSDELNRAGAMAAGIKPLAQGMSFVGQALTVQCMVADNAALHYALTVAWPGAVLTVDAGGFLGNAVWGGILHYAAKKTGLAAVVVDGAMRDVAEIRVSGLPAFSRGIVPTGPHKAWGGAINGPIQCGGVPVMAGDLLIGDDDGIVVVRPDQTPGLLERCHARLAKEKETLARIDKGERTVDLIGMPPADQVGH